MDVVLELVTETTFGEIAALLALAAVVGFIGLAARQPLIVSFIAVGLLAGPSVLGLVQSAEQIELLSELGIALLLFLVGIKLDVKLIRSLGSVSLLTGLGQVAFTSIFGFLIGLMLGLDQVTSLYVAVALTFSSTIIIVKLLSDKREIDTLHGQIALGFLIVQDLVVVLAMIVLSTIGIGASDDGPGIPFVLISGLVMVGTVFVFIRFLADPLTSRLARAPELLMIFAIALAAMFAAVGDFVGLGKEVGGLMAGVALASTPFRETISARLAPLRDFLLLFFFLALGSSLDLSTLGSNVTAAIVFSIFVLVGNPLIVLIIMGTLGYRKRTSMLAGLTVAQISEFSLIFVAMGVTLGQVSPDALGLVTMVGIVTIAASTYMITYSHRLYDWLEPVLGVFERKGTPREPRDAAVISGAKYDVLVFGLGRFGSAIGRRLKEKGISALGVDYSPDAVHKWRSLGLEAEFGDMTDPEIIAELPIASAKWIISTVPIQVQGLTQEDSRRALIQLAGLAGFEGQIAVVSHNEEETRGLASAGADVVLEPFELAAERAVENVHLQGTESGSRSLPPKAY
nr:cation:proton antiporter [Altererythrobacter sp. KTW20L]